MIFVQYEQGKQGQFELVCRLIYTFSWKGRIISTSVLDIYKRYGVQANCTSGLVVEQYPATVQTRVRFPAGAFGFKPLNLTRVRFPAGAFGFKPLNLLSLQSHYHDKLSFLCLHGTIFIHEVYQITNQHLQETLQH